jgi:diguanylate cyclase (GGDEF)-like protein
MNTKYRSVYFIAGIFIFLLVVQVVLYGSFFNELKSGTEVINDLSRIRGSIQRYTKLELSGTNINGSELAVYIDGLITRNMDTPTESEVKSVSSLYDMKMLNTKWDELKLIVRDYHADPIKANLLAVISKSEECWEVADATVVRQQYIVNKTAAYYKYFTVTFCINLFFIILVLLFYKRYIHNSLASSAIHDALTGVFNKGYFSEYLEHEIARAIRKQIPFSLIMLDIDHFKNVNDSYGHRRGDYALKTLADVVRKSKRNADVLARIGGEEFIILLPDTGLLDAGQLAERVRKSVEDFPFEEIGKLTVSLGVTEFNQADNQESILKRVDSALYLAKGNGRNRTEIIGGEPNE